ncbi:M61 family metallopeptidase [Sphaerotilus mobilis]|uniref:Putative metalloprotease with PDZ domain n=1 Tax=Sphaerotilus mobilis TaxID=47994 RepID=A0A4Q7LKS7_9BURK|nr:PDZ domain-containing protein [Sphaerotilus mobilis]RZS54407.1 putative metalloprotease with PDZ domain [Sphaerotilus mobilis]
MVRYHVELADLHAHHYRVTLTLAQPAPRQRLTLPVWIPGSYLVREFSRHLSGLEARQGREARPLRQIDKCSWEIDCSGRAALTVTWLVYAFDASVRTAWLDTQRGFFNGTSLFLSAAGREDEEHVVTLGDLPEGWQVSTGLDGTPKKGYAAPSYDALIDHPFELGPFWIGRFEACGVPHEFVVAGAAPGFDGERLLADTQRICEAEIRFWHGDQPPPFTRYVFQLALVDDGYGGLEHRNSTALIAGRRDLPRRGQSASEMSEGYVTLLGLISHEYFHTWNVKRLKPAEFLPYDLGRENHTELLWFFEGFTSYYDDLFLLRTGLIDQARYLKLLAKTINQVLATPGRQVQSVAEASFDAWLKYYRPDENSANATVSYYTKGALVALTLDLRLRGEGRGSLDEVMRCLWQTSGAAAGHDGPVTHDDIAAALQAVGRRRDPQAWAAELEALVRGTDELPLASLLADVLGYAWRHEPPTVAQRLGARVADGSLKVQAVQRGSAAERAGLAAGDELLALNGWRLARLDDLLLYGGLDQAQPLLVARDRRVLTLTLPASRPAGLVALSPQDKATAVTLRRRSAWAAPSGG